MQLEAIIQHIIRDTDFARYAKKYNIPPRKAYQYPDTYWNLLLQGKKPPISMLPPYLQDSVRTYLRNGHDPLAKGTVLILTLATSFAASEHAPEPYQELRVIIEDHLKAYVAPTNHF